MKERGHPPVSAHMLAAFVDGEVTRSEAELIEAELADSAAVRRQLAELRRIRDTLSSPVPELETMDLVAGVRVRIAGERRPRPRASRLWVVAASACAAAACALAIVYRAEDARRAEPTADRQQDGDFRAKSDQPARAVGARWAGIQAYSVVAGAAPQPLGGRLSHHAQLLFSYTNLGPEPFTYLMIFVTDARGEVHWCHPAYEEAGTNPAALRVRKGEATIPLAELIHFDLAPGPAALHALFSMQPLRVWEVETRLNESHTPHAHPSWPDTLHQVFQVEVEP